MRFGFEQPLVGEKRCVMTLITAAEGTICLGQTFGVYVSGSGFGVCRKVCDVGFIVK